MRAPLKLAELRAPLAFVLGSGLGHICDRFGADVTVPFDDIPGVGSPGVDGHEGMLARVHIAGRACLFVKGRRHRYEGDMLAIASLVEALREAGVRRLILTCAAGCLNPAIGAGEVMLIDDVINLQFHQFSAVKGARNSRALDRKLELDRGLSRRLALAASAAGVRLTSGVLASLPGPTYETPAEIRALRRIGVDAVSMSVVPELHAATSLGMRVAGLAHMTNWAAGMEPGALRHQDVLDSSRAAADSLARLIAEFVSAL